MILMPEALTAENGAKAALIGEFHETFTHECSECGGDGLGYASPHTQGETPCELCSGTGELVERIPVQWTTIKEIYKRAVALLGQSQSDAIAEAVAAGRERILRTHNISIKDDLFWYFDDREYGHNDASELLQAGEFEIVHIATGRNTGEMFGFSSGNDHYFFKTEAEAVATIEAIRSAAK